MNLIGAEHPFFRIAWRRYAAVAACAGLAIMEWIIGDPFWGVLFTGMTALAAWDLIINYKLPAEKGDPDAKP